MANKTTIEKLLLKLGGVFPGNKIGPDGIETYCEMLEDISDSDLIAGTKECLMTCRFFPTIAELREKAEEHRQRENAKIALEALKCRAEIVNGGLCSRRNYCSMLGTSDCKEEYK